MSEALVPEATLRNIRSQLGVLALRLRGIVTVTDDPTRASIASDVADELIELAGRESREQAQRIWISTVQRKLELHSRGSAAVLVHLLAHPGLPQAREEIGRVLRTRSTSLRVLAVYVHWLRASLRKHDLAEAVQTLHGEGYFISREDARAVLELLV